MESIPRPKGLPIIGTKLDLIKGGLGTKLHEFIDARHRHLGNIFIENFGTTDLIFVSDADLIRTLFISLEGKYPSHILPDPWLLYEKLYGQKRGLLFMDGEEWLQNRRIMNKLLLREGAESCIKNSVAQTIQTFIQTCAEKSENEIIFKDIASNLYKLSTEVLIQVLIGNTDPLKGNHYDELLQIFTESVKKIFQTTTKLYGLPITWCQRLNLKVWRDFKEAVDVSLLLGNKLVNEMLALKRSEDGLMSKMIKENMNDQTISRIVVDFIIAAGDTTAYTSLWILYLLSRNTQEINAIRINGQTYIPFVIKEAMRLYPVAPFLTRILPQDGILGQYNVKKAKRHLSLESVVKWQQETYMSISNSTLVNFMQDGLLQIHEVSGLNWWCTIVSSTILIRACMTLPLTVYQNYILAKVENIGLELKDLVNELKKETSIARKVYSLNDKQTVLLYKRSLKKQWRQLIERDNCHPLKATLVIWFQIPLWVCMSFAIRNLVNMHPPHPSAMVTFMELSTGGFGWIPNLIEPDHSFILPVAFGLTNLAIIEIQRMSKLREPSRVYNIFTNVFRGFSIVMIPIAANVPSCLCLYWVTSSAFGLIQNLCLLSPSLRRKLRIPLAPSELENPYTPIIASIYTSGREQKYFSEPESFLPYRWDRHDERKKGLSNHVSYASLPFALGARSCVGRKIAMVQMTELIWQVVDSFDLVCLNGDSITPITSQALIPNKKIEIHFKKRV
ncbi:unnamed protein product [Leptosia nina]|uniref:Membrane insertase YidC/Oxa/ALB C-terminal domain-containing protein n=1 Tax=Leptosia nina TaxID=320188 RepID=A0AAV1JQN5_9NEOP